MGFFNFCFLPAVAGFAMTDSSSPLPTRRVITQEDLIAMPPRLPGDWDRLPALARGERLLHMATVESHLRFVKGIAASGFNLEVQRPATLPNGQPDAQAGSTPLLMALQARAWRNAQALLDAGANPRATDAHGGNVWTCLLSHSVVMPRLDGRTIKDLVGALIAAGADVNQRRERWHAQNEAERDNTALHLAYQHSLYDLVEVLLAAGAEPQALAHAGREELRQGRSLLHDLMYFHDREQPASAMAELSRLLDLGLDPNAMAYASDRRTPLGVVPVIDEVAVALIEQGGHLGEDGERYRLAWLRDVVHASVREGLAALLPILQRFGMTNPDRLRDHNGATPLASLLDQGRTHDPVDRLRAYLTTFPQANLAAVDAKGFGLVHTAAFHGHAQCLRELIQRGAPVALTTHQGTGALDELARGRAIWNHRATFESCAQQLFDAGLVPRLDATAHRSVNPGPGWDAMTALYVQWEQHQLRLTTGSGDPSSPLLRGDRRRL